MTPIFDLSDVQSELDQADTIVDSDSPYRTVYLGTVFSMLPSGKYYQPWANSNVDPCPRCAGRGTVANPKAHQHDHDRARRLQMRLVQQGAWRDHRGARARLHAMAERAKRTYPTVTCPFCDGCGSREAALDARWTEQAESELSTIGAWLESGEGDPCDMFIGQLAPDEEEEDEDDTPQDDDYTITPAGSLGGCYAVGIITGPFIGQYVELDHAERAIRDRMEADQFWPNVWDISDHGNVSLHTMHE